MTAHVWTKLAMASALMVWGMSVQAQTSSGGMAAGQGAHAQQTRPAPVSGKVGSDPAAVALRPAAQVPTTSKATQVAPPANPNEPLFSPTAETATHATASATSTAAATTPAPAKTTEPVAQQRKPHVDRTTGVKKPTKTEPQAHDKKVSGKPRHGNKGAAPSEGAKKDVAPHKGKKKADDKQAAKSAHQKLHLKSAHQTEQTAAPLKKSQALAKHGTSPVGKQVVSAKAPTKSSVHRPATPATAKASAGKVAAKRPHSKAKGEHVAIKSTPAPKASAPVAGKKASKAGKDARAAHKAA